MALEDSTNLLTGARADGRSKSALALYEGVGEDDLVSEEIDERILKLLGLDDVFDIDYGTYISLLKEKLVASRNFDKKLSVEEDELLVSEFRRVKGKVGRFKLKKKKITSETIGTTGPIQISRDKFFLATKAIVPVTPTAAGESSKDIKDIEKALDDILKSLTLQNNEKKKRSENERKKLEDRRRGKRESDLEKPLTQLKALAKKIIAPAQGILDRIFRFIKFTLLGYAFNQLVKWFSDPKNAEKIKVLGRFLKDWWPALLSAYVLFATPFGKFIRTTLGMLRGLLPRLINLVKTHPLIAAGAITGLAAGAAEMWRQKEEKRQIEKEAQRRKVEPKVVQKEVTEAKKSPFALFGEAMQNIGPLGFSGGGSVPKVRNPFSNVGQSNNVLDIKDAAFAGGGGITDDSGIRVKGAGPDTQLIAAAPGEVVMSKKAVDKYGANFFLDLNKRAGGTNIPKMVNNIQLAAGGGLIKRTIKSFQGGGMVSGGSASGSGSSPQFSFDLPRYTGSMIRDYPLSTMERSSVLNSPLPRLQKSNDYSLRQKIITDIPIPENELREKVSNPRGSTFIPYNSQIQEPIKHPFVDVIDQQNIDYKMFFAPSDYDKYDPEQNTIHTFRPSNNRPVPPGPPVLISRTTYTVLPPVKASRKEPSIPRGSKLPEFIVSSNNDSRSNIAMKLGIADLVGVA